MKEYIYSDNQGARTPLEFAQRHIEITGGNPDYLLSTALPTREDWLKIKNIEEVANRIVKANEEGKKIAIVGDYDADGITSSVMLKEFFVSMGYKAPIVRIPTRDEGYGMSNWIVEELARSGVEMIITVDNGIASGEAVKLAQSKGIEVIVTDHHPFHDPTGRTAGEDNERNNLVPDCLIVNPNHNDSEAYRHFSGCGVAWGVLNIINEEKAAPLIDFVAVSIVSDMVPMEGFNHAIYKKGLELIRTKIATKITDTSISVLIDLAEKDRIANDIQYKNPITPFDHNIIGFRIAPLLNAAGRRGDPMDIALPMLNGMSSADYAHIKAVNDERKLISDTATFKAIEKFRTEKPRNFYTHIDDEMGNGVAGLVAGGIVREFNRPAVVFFYKDIDRTILSGSGRAPNIKDFNFTNLIDALNQAGIETKGGGHSAAAGFSIKVEDFIRFSEFAEKYMEEYIPKIMPTYVAYPIKTLSDLDIAREVANILGPYRPQFMVSIPIEKIQGSRLLSSKVGDPHVKYFTGSNGGFHVFHRGGGKNGAIDINDFRNYGTHLVLSIPVGGANFASDVGVRIKNKDEREINYAKETRSR